MRTPFILISLSILLVLSSCVSRKKLTYLKYSEKSTDYSESLSDLRASVTPPAYKVMPYDNLYIRVVTPDPQWSALFNIDIGNTSLNQESAGLLGYLVDIDGNIEVPYIGKVMVGGNTLSEVKIHLDTVFRNYVTDAAITVKLVNNAISVIGEVNNPGRYILSKDRITILDALSLAGDLTSFGNRQKIQLIRPSSYGPVIKEISISDRSIMTSEFYYVMPNDIIYVLPTQGRSFLTNSSVYTLFLSTLTTALVVISYFQLL